MNYIILLGKAKDVWKELAMLAKLEKYGIGPRYIPVLPEEIKN